MSDIVERLKEPIAPFYDPLRRDQLMREAAAEIEKLRAEEYRYAITCRAIPDEFALKPPDGGDVKPWEAVSEMANAIARMREALNVLSDHWRHGYGGPTRGDLIRAVEGIARAALGDTNG